MIASEPTSLEEAIEIIWAQSRLIETQTVQIEAQAGQIKEQASYIEILRRRIEELEAKLNKNSKNSSKPPSSDQQANTGNKRKQSKRARRGKSRSPYPPDRVDCHVECTKSSCPHCASTSLGKLGDAPFVWQQVELPAVRAIVTQYSLLKYRCGGCGKRCLGELPEGVPFSAFGPRLMALVANLTGCFHLAKREAMQLIKDLYDIDLSAGSVINVEENVSDALEACYERIHQFVVQGALPRHFDETSWRDSGKRHYVWTATTALAACFRIDPSRSQEAFRRLIGPKTGPPSVTDRYAVYNALKGPHQYCLAHLIRDFHFFAEGKGSDSEIGSKIEQEFRRACRIHSHWRKGQLSKRQWSCRLSYSQRRLDELFTDGLTFGSDDLANLIMRLDENSDCLWAFRSVEMMDPTNNLAERDLRKLVLWRKKSYGTRSSRGQRFVERISSVAETLKKNGKNILTYLECALQAFYLNQSPPLVAPAQGF